jgi:hypothetical protein
MVLMSDAVIRLDTTVVSELMRLKPAQPVLGWFAARDSTKLFLARWPRPNCARARQPGSAATV